MVKKRFLLLFGVLFLLIPSIYADYTKEVFEDMINSGNSTTINSDTFTFTIKQGGTLSTLVTFPDDHTVSVKLGDYIERGKYRVYFDKISKKIKNTTQFGTYAWLDFNESVEFSVSDFISLDGLWHPGDDYTSEREFYKLGMRVFERLPHVEITRDITKTNLIVGEKTTIELEFINDGSTDATNIRFEDSFPYPYFKFQTGGYTGCTWAGEKMKWTSDTLRVDQKVECSYTLYSTQPIYFESKPMIKYWDGFRTNTTYGDEVGFTIYQQGVNIEATLNQTKASIDEIILLDINLTNINENYTSTVEFTIETPSGLEILNKPSLKMKWYGDYKLVYNGIIEENASEQFPLKLRPNSAGYYNISLKNIYTTNSFRSREEKYFGLDVTIPALDIIYDFNTATLWSGQQTNLKINVNNPLNSFVKDLHLTIGSNIPSIGNNSKWIYELGEGSSKEFFNLNLIAPEVNEEKEFYITSKLKYTTSSKQEFELEEKKTVTVIPKQETEEESDEETDKKSDEEDSKLGELEGLSTEEMLAKMNQEAGLVEGEQEPKEEITETELETKSTLNIWIVPLNIVLILLIVFLVVAIKRTKVDE